MTTLSFYDHNRQRYASQGVTPRAGEDEFMIGGYVDGGGVDERGEFGIVLHRFGHANIRDLRGPQVPDATMSPQLCVFGDAFDALRECIALGLLDALEVVTIRTPNDLTSVLLSLGLRDRSDNPVQYA